MLRAIILLITVLVSLGLIYAIGAWVLVVLFAVSFAAVIFSSRDVEESAPAPQDQAKADSETPMSPNL